MQELRLVAVSEDGTYLVLATAGRGTRFTLPVDDRLRAAVRGNFSRLGQYEIEVESPLRPKEIQARIRAGETAEEIAATAGIPVERVRWFEGPVLQEREYVAQQAQRCTVRLPGDSAAGPTLGDLVAERLTRRGVPADEIDWDSAKRDDNLWRIKLGFVWNGHTRSAEWLFDPRRRHITPHDDEAMRLSASEYVDPAEDTKVTPFVPRAAKLAPVPPLGSEPLNQPPVSFPAVVRQEPPAVRQEPAAVRQEPATPSRPAYAQPEPSSAPYFQPEAPAAAAERPVAYERPPMPPLPEGFEPPAIPAVPPLRAPGPGLPEATRGAGALRAPSTASSAESREFEAPADFTESPDVAKPAAPADLSGPAELTEPVEPVEFSPTVITPSGPGGSRSEDAPGVPESPEAPAAPAVRENAPAAGVSAEPASAGAAAEAIRAAGKPAEAAEAAVVVTAAHSGPDLRAEDPQAGPARQEEEGAASAEPRVDGAETAGDQTREDAPVSVAGPRDGAGISTDPETVKDTATAVRETEAGDPPVERRPQAPAPAAEETPPAEPSVPAAEQAPPAKAPVPAAEQAPPAEPSMPAAEQAPPAKAPVPAAEQAPEPPPPPAAPVPKPAPTRPARKSRGRRASVPTWDEIMFGARRPD
ncbi:septation protein SepH [Planobispora rosea]|uniref:septation protein SepH n=1 Tax=Planobispora rosea TaxID=35762 RepID=UPI000A018C68|nr:septation protein SepH [Planobispora rosea]